MRRILIFILCALFLAGLEATPRLVLHFDVNKTITAIDTAKNSTVNQEETIVFPSFYKLITFMDEQGIEYSIVLRTFGQDLQRVANEIEVKTHKIFFEQYPKFVSGKLHVNDVVLSSPQEIYSYFCCNQHVAVQDEYSWWASHRKATLYGKPFYVNLKDEKTVHLFFDDHISTNDRDPSIVAAFDALLGKQLSAQELAEKGIIYKVDPSEAMLNENYYIEKIRLFVSKHPSCSARS